MTANEERRLKRLNYLVSRLWPPQEQASIELSNNHWSVVGQYGHPLLRVPKMPAGLDALEAALCAMAREMPSWLLTIVEEWERQSYNQEGSLKGDCSDTTRLACAEEIRRTIWRR